MLTILQRKEKVESSYKEKRKSNPPAKKRESRILLQRKEKVESSFKERKSNPPKKRTLL